MKLWNAAGTYSKGVVVVSAAVVTSLVPFYGGDHWFVGLTAGIGALNTILVANQPKP